MPHRIFPLRRSNSIPTATVQPSPADPPVFSGLLLCDQGGRLLTYRHNVSRSACEVVFTACAQQRFARRQANQPFAGRVDGSADSPTSIRPNPPPGPRNRAWCVR